jgi:hypothetical protein
MLSDDLVDTSNFNAMGDIILVSRMGVIAHSFKTSRMIREVNVTPVTSSAINLGQHQSTAVIALIEIQRMIWNFNYFGFEQGSAHLFDVTDTNASHVFAYIFTQKGASRAWVFMVSLKSWVILPLYTVWLNPLSA